MWKMILVLTLAVLLPFFGPASSMNTWAGTLSDAVEKTEAPKICKIPPGSVMFADPQPLSSGQWMRLNVTKPQELIPRAENPDSEVDGATKNAVEGIKKLLSEQTGQDWSDMGYGDFKVNIPCDRHPYHYMTVFFHKNDCE